MKIGAKLQSAFSLLELSIILTGASVLITNFVAIKGKVDDGSKYLETKQKIQAIEIAVAAYYAKNGHFPCPADPTMNIKDRLVGTSENTIGDTTMCDSSIVSSDGKFYAGSVPTRELGLSYEYIVDGWDNKLTFIVPADAEFDAYIAVPDAIANIPTNYINLITWMDASDVPTITMDGSNKISQINDKSGNGYHLKQGTSGFKPEFVVDGDLPAISFDGVDDRLYIDTNYYVDTGPGYDGSLSKVTIFVAFKTTAVSKQIFVGYDGNNYWRANMKSDGSLNFTTTAFGSADLNMPTPSSGYSDGNVYILAATYDGSASSQKEIFVNNVSEISESPYTGAPKLGTGTTRYGYVGVGSEAITAGGAISDDGSFVNGYLYEILVYENSFSEANMTIINNYLIDKWKNGYAAYNPPGSFLKINDINGSLIEDEAVFAVVSYGPTGDGAYRRGGAVNASTPASYNVLASGFDSQNIITDYMIDGSDLVERMGWKDGFSQIVRYYTVADIQNIQQ